MLRRVVLVRTEVCEERIASIIRVTRIGDLRTTLAVRVMDGICNWVAMLVIFKRMAISRTVVIYDNGDGDVDILAYVCGELRGVQLALCRES
jgi:hypothetical protein